MIHISNDSKINEMCNKMIASKRWRLARHSKHPVLIHKSKGAKKLIAVPATPSDKRAYANFRRDYNQYIRQYLINCGVIINKLGVRHV